MHLPRGNSTSCMHTHTQASARARPYMYMCGQQSTEIYVKVVGLSFFLFWEKIVSISSLVNGWKGRETNSIEEIGSMVSLSKLE